LPKRSVSSTPCRHVLAGVAGAASAVDMWILELVSIGVGLLAAREDRRNLGPAQGQRDDLRECVRLDAIYPPANQAMSFPTRVARTSVDRRGGKYPADWRTARASLSPSRSRRAGRSRSADRRGSRAAAARAGGVGAGAIRRVACRRRCGSVESAFAGSSQHGSPGRRRTSRRRSVHEPSRGVEPEATLPASVPRAPPRTALGRRPGAVA
jgi:hypothetical protein